MRRILRAFTAVAVLTASAGLADGRPVNQAPTKEELQAPQKPQDGEASKRAARPTLEVVFVIDTTGSMGGLIEGAKQKIWSIASRMASGKPTPRIRVGLVAYRDRGDEYVTKRFDLSDDLDTVYKNLQGFQAGGGGDAPESVGQGLADAVGKMTWSQDTRAAKMIFVVGDQPGHDYGDGSDVKTWAKKAISKGIVVNTVRCGGDPNAEQQFREVARLADGRFDSIAQDGGMLAVVTPFDDEVAKLNAEVVSKSVVGGSRRARDEGAGMMATLGGMGAGSVASRMEFNAKAPAAKPAAEPVAGAVDLTVAPGKLKELKEEELPDQLRGLKPAEREAFLKKNAEEKKALEEKLSQVAKQRAEWLTKNAKAAKADSFDERVFESVKRKAADVGVGY